MGIAGHPDTAAQLFRSIPNMLTLLDYRQRLLNVRRFQIGIIGNHLLVCRAVSNLLNDN